MKKIFFFIILIFSSNILFAQTNSNKIDSTIYRNVDIEASFPGGDDSLNLYLNKNLHYPQDDVNLTVVVEFIVNTDGSISEIKSEKSGYTSFDIEAKRLIKNSPKWLPATLNSKIVRSYKIVHIIFELVE